MPDLATENYFFQMAQGLIVTYMLVIIYLMFRELAKISKNFFYCKQNALMEKKIEDSSGKACTLFDSHHWLMSPGEWVGTDATRYTMLILDGWGLTSEERALCSLSRYYNKFKINWVAHNQVLVDF